MARIEDGGLHQRAVLWPVQRRADGEVRHDQFGNVMVEDTPIEIPVRWLTTRTDRRDADGTAIALDASAVVDREITVGSRMALGDFEELGLLGTALAAGVAELMVVVSYDEAPDIRNRACHREVGLAKHRDTIPSEGQ